jgi:serine/threonine protein kinase
MTNMLENVQKEIAIMKKISHPNCVHMYEVIDDPNNNKLYIRLEYVEGGQCMEAANGTPPLSVDLAKNYFIDLISGLEYIHFNHILHRDLKPENLLVTKDGILKLADFGVSSPLENEDNDLMNKTGEHTGELGSCSCIQIHTKQ